MFCHCNSVPAHADRGGVLQADLLAVTIGNVHGEYAQPPHLDFPRLEAIRRAVPAHTPLVLHGASGLSAQWISGAMLRGVCKFNVNTDLRNAALAFQREAFTRDAQVSLIRMFCVVSDVTLVLVGGHSAAHGGQHRGHDTGGCGEDHAIPRNATASGVAEIWCLSCNISISRCNSVS